MASIVGFLFYIWAIFPLIFELTMINKEAYSSYQNIIKSKPKTKEDITVSGCIGIVFMIGYLLWNMVGLFTSQWLLFILLFLFSVVHSYIFKGKYWYNVVDSILSICLLLFIILNKYQFHINWKQYLGNLF